ncbi:MAG: DUF3365 domain-containing protein [Gammaproteobacteria bacterium]|nr:DUF3365 domain-containing protein [Gammaproteobacteria bacterium]
MKKLISVALLCTAPVSLLMANEADVQKRVEDSRAVIQQFAQQLQGELGKAMKAGGPVAAIEVCQSAAPAIAEAESRKHGWTVGRTTTKLRNTNNAPDEWELATLQKFEERIAKGESPMGMGHFEVVSQNGREVFRFMSAIGMPSLEQAPCLHCHGENIDTKITAKLDSLYPTDNARGYRPGMLRGAFTITQPMN